MNRAKLILAFLALMAIYHTAGTIWGIDAKFYFLIGIIVISGLLLLVTFVLTRRLRGTSTDASASADSASDSDTDLDDLIPIPGPKLSGIRRCIDGALGLVAALCPPLLVSAFGGDRLAWDAPFTGYHVLSMFVGFTLYLFVRPWLWRSSSS